VSKVEYGYIFRCYNFISNLATNKQKQKTSSENGLLQLLVGGTGFLLVQIANSDIILYCYS